MNEGELFERDGRFELRFVRELSHPVEKVWDAVTSPEGLAAWFPFDALGRGPPWLRRALRSRGRDDRTPLIATRVAFLA